VRAFAAPAGERSRRLQAAAAMYERAPRALLAAELWCDAALASGRGAAATAALGHAQRLAAEHGLRRIEHRIAAIRDAATARRIPAVLQELTSREQEVVALAADGLSNREIGARLYLSDGTVRNYLSTAFAKLGVSRRSELARLLAG
jgi:DNA-binding NarL/FixJ family response regulator